MLNFEEMIDAVAEKLASRLGDRLNQDCSGKVKARLLTVEQAAVYLGRTADSIRHLLSAGKIPQVRGDRRIFIDVADLEGGLRRTRSNSLAPTTAQRPTQCLTPLNAMLSLRPSRS